MMIRVIVTGVTLMLLSGEICAQRAGSGGRGQQGARHSASRSGARQGVGGVKNGPFYRGYSDGVEIYNFGYPIGPYPPRFRSRASYHIVPRTAGAAKPPPTLISVNRFAADYQRHAERLFRSGEYDDALRAVQHAVIEDPANGKLFLFQAHVALAIGDYSTATNLLRYATRSLEASDWGYVIENRAAFYSPTAFAEQLGKLKQAVHKSPDDGNLHLLLGYQYLYLGRSEEASAHLSRAIDLEVHRGLAEQLRALASSPSGTSTPESIPVPPLPSPDR